MKINLLRFIENIKRKYVYKKHYLKEYITNLIDKINKKIGVNDD